MIDPKLDPEVDAVEFKIAIIQKEGHPHDGYYVGRLTQHLRGGGEVIELTEPYKKRDDVVKIGREFEKILRDNNLIAEKDDLN